MRRQIEIREVPHQELRDQPHDGGAGSATDHNGRRARGLGRHGANRRLGRARPCAGFGRGVRIAREAETGTWIGAGAGLRPSATGRASAPAASSEEVADFRAAADEFMRGEASGAGAGDGRSRRRRPARGPLPEWCSPG